MRGLLLPAYRHYFLQKKKMKRRHVQWIVDVNSSMFSDDYLWYSCTASSWWLIKYFEIHLLVGNFALTVVIVFPLVCVYQRKCISFFCPTRCWLVGSRDCSLNSLVIGWFLEYSVLTHYWLVGFSRYAVSSQHVALPSQNL